MKRQGKRTKKRSAKSSSGGDGSLKDLPEVAISVKPSTGNKTGTWRSLRPVLDKGKCVSCMICWKFCPDMAIKLGEYPEIDLEFCKGCGICAEVCPKEAIKMVREER